MPAVPVNIAATAAPFLSLPTPPPQPGVSGANAPGDQRTLRVTGGVFVNAVATAQSVQFRSNVTVAKVSGVLTLASAIGGNLVLPENSGGYFDCVPGRT